MRQYLDGLVVDLRQQGLRADLPGPSAATRPARSTASTFGQVAWASRRKVIRCPVSHGDV
ncbi:hypothetical protein FB570_102479 [Streptomyces sp. T12]|nr:hypothetical protein FB570_102479 [Streptomyces sp. T12]